MKNSQQFVVIQLGARRNYAVPRALEQAGVLQSLYTDLVDPRFPPGLVRMLPSMMRRWQGRAPVEIPREKVRAFSSIGLTFGAWRRVPNRSVTRACVWAGRRICELTLRQGLAGATGLYTFNTAGLEALRVARQEGLRTVVDQTIAPYRVERMLVAEEQLRHPGWEEAESDRFAGLFMDREEEEWSLADTIICGSNYVRQEMGQIGGPAHLCQVVPTVNPGNLACGPRTRGRKLRVLFCGSVGLRKGIPYLLAAAGQLRDIAEFRVVGSIGITREAAARLGAVVDLRGPVPRSEVQEHYQWADVLLLPSLCEGSAGVTYEAARCGLPIIVTPNTGSLVRDGVDGFVVPIRDAEAIAGRIRLLQADHSRLEEMSQAARTGIQNLLNGSYSGRLLQAISNSPMTDSTRQAA